VVGIGPAARDFPLQEFGYGDSVPEFERALMQPPVPPRMCGYSPTSPYSRIASRFDDHKFDAWLMLLRAAGR
jgi:hypothetical protein